MTPVNNIWDFFNDNKEDCPSNDQTKCTRSISYNQHVNDPRYGDCCLELCPVFFWIQTLIEHQ